MSAQYCCSICLIVKQAYDFTSWLRWKQLHGEELAGEPVDDECVRIMFADLRKRQQENKNNTKLPIKEVVKFFCQVCDGTGKTPHSVLGYGSEKCKVCKDGYV